MAGATASPQLISLIARLVERAAGIHHGSGDQAIFEAKLAAHVSNAAYPSLLDYYYRLRYDDPEGHELRRLIEALLVHETYFFRELGPLVGVVDHLAEVVRRRGAARVWSAGCATGEEPFSLAMLLDSRAVLGSVEVVASDLSAQAIARARSGLYPARSLRDGHPPELARRYLNPTERGLVVSSGIRDRVAFHTANLTVEDQLAPPGAFDAILCRNVLIYFRDEQAREVVERLGRRLAAGGLLAVGVSESLLRLDTSLVCWERDGNFFYRGAV